MRQRTHPLKLTTLFAALALALSIALGACGDDDDSTTEAESVGAEPAALQELHVVTGHDTNVSHGAPDMTATTGEYTFGIPDEVRAGPTRISVTNDGAEPHHAQLLRLNPGVTLEQLTQALAANGPPAALEYGTFEGGTALVSPGETSRADAVVDLTEGEYAFLCFIETPAGVPHFAHGMARVFTVVPNDGATSAPRADGEIGLVDYGFAMGETLRGDELLEVRNDMGTEPHEVVVARLDDGTTVADFEAALDNRAPLPATAYGGMQAVLPGTTQLLQLDLEPGRYVLWCEIPSTVDGEAHRAKGMIRELEVG